MNRSLSSILTVSATLLFLCSAVTNLLLAQPAPSGNCGDIPGWGEPTLTAHVNPSGFVMSLPPSAPERFRTFRGLLIEETVVKEIYPVLPLVFFDEGRSTIPTGYHLFADPDQTRNFADTIDFGRFVHYGNPDVDDTVFLDRIGKWPDPTLQRHWEILNVIGYRMRRHPETKISIGGYDSRQPKLGETSSIAEARAKAVYDYLYNIWQIEPSRLRLVPSGGYPRVRSNIKDPITNTENRRVEILSDDWEIVKPIVSVELRRYVDYKGVRFAMRNGVPDSVVARREIEISRKQSEWFTMREIGISDPFSPEYMWGKGGDEDVIPVDEAPYVAQLVVYTKDGRQCRSQAIEIPVMIVTEERKRDEVRAETTRGTYRLVLFGFESSAITNTSLRIIREYIVGDLRVGAQVYVTGYSSAESKAEKLSKARASAVAEVIRKHTKPGIYTTLEATGEGDTHPLYENDFPEGRFLNRIVQVRVVTPPRVEK